MPAQMTQARLGGIAKALREVDETLKAILEKVVSIEQKQSEQQPAKPSSIK